MCDVMVERVRQDGSVDGSRASSKKLRRMQGGLLIAFLAFQQQAMHPGSLRGWPREVAALLAGACLFALLAVGWTLIMRCGDERRKASLKRAVLFGVAITMGLACVVGYWEVAMERSLGVPLLAFPTCLVLATAAAKVVSGSHRRWLGLPTGAR